MQSFDNTDNLYRVFNPTREDIQQYIDGESSTSDDDSTTTTTTTTTYTEQPSNNELVADEYFDKFISDTTLDGEKFINDIHHHIKCGAWDLLGDQMFEFIEYTSITMFTTQQKKILDYFWIYQCKKCHHWAPNENTVLSDVNSLQNCKNCLHIKETKRLKSKVKIQVGSVEEGQDYCYICHDDYKTDAHIGQMPCGHKFHKNCILNWVLEHNPNCPCCRTEISATKHVPVRQERKQKKGNRKPKRKHNRK